MNDHFYPVSADTYSWLTGVDFSNLNRKPAAAMVNKPPGADCPAYTPAGQKRRREQTAERARKFWWNKARIVDKPSSSS